MLAMRNQRGFSLLELAIVVIVMSALAAIMLDRLQYYQEAAEKAKVEYTISAMKSGLRSRMAHMLIEGRSQEYMFLAMDNPINWLESRPANYLGELSEEESDTLRPGSWYYNPATRTLVYAVKFGKYLEPDSVGKKRIRLRVEFKKNFPTVSSQANDMVHQTDSVALELVEKFKWF
ncbi:type II secretion system protein [Herbaspirillum sp. HC18]|nr:type II secretion system protein [Herbaspirillum sp. HC18]